MSGRNYPADTQRQRFFEEFYNKERDTRIASFDKARASREDGEDEEAGKSRQYEVFRKKIEGQRPNKQNMGKKLPPIDSNKFRKKSKESIDASTESDPSKKSESNVVLEMRPVPSTAKAVLYKGFSKDETGRYRYLRDRYKIDPEEKFEYPLLSSWEYGWRLGDFIKKDDIRKPKHGRTRIVKDTFYTRTGVPALN